MADDRPEQADSTDERSTALPGKVERWRRRSATGAIMSGFAFGLQQVFEPERDEPSIVQETSGVPPEDLAVDAEFDPVASKRTVVRIRPWLLDNAGNETAAAETADNETAATDPGTTGSDASGAPQR